MIAAAKNILMGRSIRGRAVRFLMLVGVVPLLTAAAYISLSQRAVLSETANDNLANHALLQAASVERLLGEAAADVEVLASNPVLRSRTSSLEDKSRQMREAQDFFEVFEDITLIDPQGRVINSTTYSYYGSWSEKAWFEEALGGRPAISEAHRIPSPGRLVVVFTAPVYSDGVVSAVVAGQMNMERVWEILDSTTIGETGFVAAFDRHDNFIAHPDKELILSKADGYPQSPASKGLTSMHLQNAEGEGLVGQMAPVGVLGWEVAALQESSETYALVSDTIGKVLVAVAVVVAITIVASLLFSRAITRPIRDLGGVMQRFTGGSLDERAPLAALREMDDLSASFNSMAARLQDSTHRLERANEELERRYGELVDARAQAATDALTGLSNHRAFHERIRGEASLAQETGHPVGLIMMDIDDFKRVNDSQGHLAGDQILRELAPALTAVAPPENAYRYGGDEFAILLPGADCEKTAGIAERLRRSVEKGSDGDRITVSLGVASFPDAAASVEELIYGADVAMYWAKSAGKNRVGEWRKLLTNRADGGLPWYTADRAVHAPDVVIALGAALSAKDPTTSAHTERCSWYAAKLADELGLGEKETSVVRLASLLHDVGKLAVPDAVLFKPGPLNEDEWAQMKQHPTAALRILGQIRSLTDATPTILHHHEHFDGSGYPDGLSGDQIPIASRILLVTDAFDAMTTDRPYRKAMSIEAAIEELKRNKGSQFDPVVVDAFLRVLDRHGAQPLRWQAAGEKRERHSDVPAARSR